MKIWQFPFYNFTDEKKVCPRHTQANDLIKRALNSAHVPAIREPPGLSRQDDKRPDGLTLLPWAMGKSLIWDFTCVDSLATSHVEGTSKEAGHAASKAEKKKLSHYADLANNYTIMPVAVETLGSFAPMGMKFLKEVGSRISEVTGDARSPSFLFQAIGISIQKGNAASIAGTVPLSKKLDELYYLL